MNYCSRKASKSKILNLLFSLLLLFTSICSATPAVFAATASTTVTTTKTNNIPTRLGGYDRYSTAVQIADHGWQSASTAVLAPSGDPNMVDALAASSLAKAVDGSILLVDRDSVPSSTMAELKKLGVTKVYLVSGTAVISTKVESDLTAAGIQSLRLGGNDRYETAINIAKEIQKIKPFKEIIVTNSYANADAISIAPIAAAKGIPVLLVDLDSVPQVVSDFINTSGINRTYIIGGTAVVSDSDMDVLPNPMRLGGNDRFDTNTEVLKQFENLLVGGSMFYANGSDTSLIDSLTGAPVAAKFNGAIVLSNKDALPTGTKEFIQKDISLKNPVILGGTAVMSDEAIQSLGYTQPDQSAIQNGAVELNTPNASLKDVTVNGSIYLDADGETLQNVIVNGTVFVDPGKDGSVTLDGVQATKIVVLSGADHSIHLKGTKSDWLLVSSSSAAHIVAETGTTIGSTLVLSDVTVESQSGANIGILTAQPRQDAQINIRLQGTFSNAVSLIGRVNLTAADGAAVPIVMATGAADPDSIQLAGKFSSVAISDNSSLTLASGRIIKMDINGTSNIIVKSGAEVTSLSSATGYVVLSGGGTVNGKTTSNTPTSTSVTITSGSTTGTIGPVAGTATGPGSGTGTGGGKNVPLGLENSYPQDGAANFPLDGTIILTFNKNVVDPSVVQNNKNSISIKDKSKGTNINIVFELTSGSSDDPGKRNITIKPSLESGKNYAIMISSSFKAKSGDILNKQITIAFSTPSDGNTGVITTPLTDAQAVAADKSALVIGYASGDSASSVTQNLTLPTSGSNGSTITWSSDIPTIIANNGTVIHPDFNSGDTTVNLTATIAKGSTSDTMVFALTVKAASQTDAEAVAADKAVLAIGYTSGDSAGSVTQNVTLAGSGSSGTTITWSSDTSAVVANNGIVTRPTTGSAVTVILTATIARGSALDTKTFTLTVKAAPMTDAEAVADDKAGLAIGYVSGDSAGNVTKNLTLPGSGPSNTLITWSSDKPLVVANNGTVTRPGYGSSDETVKLTATIVKGSTTDTKTFTLTVKALTDIEAVEADKASLTIGYFTGSGDSAGSVTHDLALPITGTNGSAITWSSDKPLVVANNGAVTRPTTGSDAMVNLTATITKGSVSETQTFTLTVKADQSTMTVGAIAAGSVPVNAPFNLTIAGAKGINDNILTGLTNVSVTSDNSIDNAILKSITSVRLDANGNGIIPITLTQGSSAGQGLEQILTVTLHGVSNYGTLTVFVSTKNAGTDDQSTMIVSASATASNVFNLNFSHVTGRGGNAQTNTTKLVSIVSDNPNESFFISSVTLDTNGNGTIPVTLTQTGQQKLTIALGGVTNCQTVTVNVP